MLQHEAEDALYHTARVQKLIWDASKEVNGLDMPQILNSMHNGAMTAHEKALAETLLRVLRVLESPNGLDARGDVSPSDTAPKAEHYL